MKMVRIACALLASIAPIAALADPPADGLHDLTFGDQGFGHSIPFPSSMTIDEEGRVTTSGQDYIGRRLPNGLADPTFAASNGMLWLDVRRANLTPLSARTAHVPIPGGGYYAVSGGINSGGTGVSAIFRLTSSGAFDSTYGTNGIIAAPYGIVDLAIEPDGKLVLFGEPGVEIGQPHGNAWMQRLTTTGAPDPTFNQGGLLLIPSMTAASDILRAADGSYYVAGALRISFNPEQTMASIAHVLANGAIDPAFGLGGVVTPAFGVSDRIENWPSKLAQQADGKILMVGYSGYFYGQGSVAHCVAARIHASDGTLDSSFASAGKLVFVNGQRNSTCSDVALTNSGRILTTVSSVGNSFIMALNRADGSVDPSFGINGFSAQPLYFNQPITNVKLVLDAQQRIVSAAQNVFGDPMLYRLTSDRIFADALDR